jgi:hypothetical protein
MRQGVELHRMGLVLVFLTLSIFSGCGTYHNARLPYATSTAGRQESGLTVAVGSDVRVTLLSGEVFHGKILELTNHKLQLIGDGNYGSVNLDVELSEIDHVELLEKSMTDGQIEGMWFLGILVALIAGVLYGLSTLGGT